MSLTIKKSINISPGGVPVHVHLSQYDSDFSLILAITSQDDFVIPQGATAKIRGTKTDRNGYSAAASLDVAAKTVTVAGDVQLTASAGANTYELVIYSGSKQIATANFVIDVEPAALSSETAVSQSTMDEVNQALNAQSAADESAKMAASSASAASSSASAAKTSADKAASAITDAANFRIFVNSRNRISVTHNIDREG